MRSDIALVYRDQFEYFADCFELIRRRGDAYTIRAEALDAERMVSYTERSGYVSERSHFLEIYRGVMAEAAELAQRIRRRKDETSREGVRLPFDDFVEHYALRPEEEQILLVGLYNEARGYGHARHTGGHEILNLLFPDSVEALKASRFLDGGATLLRRGLMRVSSDHDHLDNFLRAAYEVTEKTLRVVLGVTERPHITEEQPGLQGIREACETSYRVVAPQVFLENVVLPPDMRRGLEEVLWQAGEGRLLYEKWGLDRVLEKGKGTVVLFAGPPGTGKTMTAEAMAHRLSRPLHIADYAELESKWIGETEKNIVEIFRAAAKANAVLLLDEADAILSSRVDGGLYNDRAYNRQVGILLRELEAFEGICILTTNRMVTLDEGLARRVSATFQFNMPGPTERLRIWESLIPGPMPLADDVDLRVLAHRYPIAGGHIKNAIRTAARRAAIRDGEQVCVRQEDLGEAAAGERRSFRPGARPIGFGEGHHAPSSAEPRPGFMVSSMHWREAAHRKLAAGVRIPGR
jgi:ATPase family associated with various cellular activities (AAA)/Winged helix domain, variant